MSSSAFDQLLAHYQQLNGKPQETSVKKGKFFKKETISKNEANNINRRRKKSKKSPLIPLSSNVLSETPHDDPPFNAEILLRASQNQETAPKRQETAAVFKNLYKKLPASTGKPDHRALPIKRVPCKFFMEGKCKKTPEECSFSHDIIPNKTPQEVMKSQVCKFYLRKACLKGEESCPFSHDVSSVPCRFYSTFGNCREGELCPYSHAVKGPSPTLAGSSSSPGLSMDYLALLDEALDAAQMIKLDIEKITENNLLLNTDFTTISDDTLGSTFKISSPVSSSSYNPFLDTN